MNNKTGIVTAVCTSDVKGIQKTAKDSVELVEDFGIANDAHAGKWHRQVSLLSQDKVDEFNKLGAGVQPGAFGENILVRGFDFKTLPVGTVFKCNDVVLEMTQIGKECHSHCQIYQKMGTCIMPHEGVFTKVVHGGTINVGDEFVLVEMPQA
ncbi:MAG: MOSC domain-containing protein [Firmicutes bacterium]|nr:MOSC domain-containing protein [Bacillota bacterium]